MNRTGIICRVEKTCYYILSDSGDFIKVKGKAGGALGEQVSVPAATRKPFWPIGATAAALLVMVLLVSWHLTPAPAPTVYRIALDINPSLELIYDDQFNVIGGQAFDETGKKVLQEVRVVSANVYQAVGRIYAFCLENGLAEQQGDVIVTYPVGANLDPDLLVGALAGQGFQVTLHIFRLNNEQYFAGSGSPLRSYLQTLAEGGDIVGKTKELAAAAHQILSGDAGSMVAIVPWYSDPAVQLLVEEYRISGKLVEEMFAAGMDSNQAARLLTVAEQNLKQPAALFLSWQQAEVSIDEFLERYRANQVKVPDTSIIWLAELLAWQYGHMPGQMAYYLQRLEVDELVGALCIEQNSELTVTEIYRLLQAGEQLVSLAERAGLSRDEYRLLHQQAAGQIKQAKGWIGTEEVRAVSFHYNVTIGETLAVLSRGYHPKEVAEVFGLATLSGHHWTKVVETLERSQNFKDALAALGIDERQGKRFEHITNLFTGDRPGPNQPQQNTDWHRNNSRQGP